MKNKALTIAVSAVAAAIVCVVAVIAVKINGQNNPAIVPSGNDYSDGEITSNYGEYTENTGVFPSFGFSEQTEASTSESFLFPSQTQQSTVPSSSEQTITSVATTVSQTATQAVAAVSGAFSEVFKMPKAPKYIPPETNIDISKINLASYRYDPEGNYYYTDDKACWQKNFGFNEVYDKLAPISIMYYDTVRTTFTYGGKEWLIQMWKGQYGMCFVGGEVGIYTRKPGSSGTHYACADKEDWLNMEMAFVWDEYADGNYVTIFTRPYTKYWWCTGFVVGFPNGNLRNTLTEFRLITHITFKDTEMANAFCNAFESRGFRRVSKLDNNVPDTFVQLGADVALVWQSIED